MEREDIRRERERINTCIHKHLASSPLTVSLNVPFYYTNKYHANITQ